MCGARIAPPFMECVCGARIAPPFMEATDASRLVCVVVVFRIKNTHSLTVPGGLSIPPGAPLRPGEALLEARTQASVAFFKLGSHSATLRPEFGGP